MRRLLLIYNIQNFKLTPNHDIKEFKYDSYMKVIFSISSSFKVATFILKLDFFQVLFYVFQPIPHSIYLMCSTSGNMNEK